MGRNNTRHRALECLLVGAVCAWPTTLFAQPLITEVAWMGSTADATGDEWLEIYNAGDEDIADLSAYTLTEGTSERTLPSVSLAAGDVLVLERNGSSTSLSPPSAELLNISLNNGGEVLKLCETAAPANCDFANPSGGSWFGGNNSTKATMIRTSTGDGSDSSNWETYSGPASNVLNSGGQGILGTPGEVSFDPSVDAGSGNTGEDAGPVQMDSGQPQPEDAGSGDVDDPLPVISEVAWMGTSAESSHEWVELYNPHPQTIQDLSSFVFIEGSTQRTLPAVSLAPGALIVFEGNANALTLESPDSQDVSLSLNNGGEIFQLCRFSDLTDCDVANPTGAAWFGGDSGDKTTMIRLDPTSDGKSSLSWGTWSGGPSTVLDSVGVPILGSPGAPNFSGGQTDGGSQVPFDAGPNEEPVLVIHDLSLLSNGDAEVTYSATDADAQDLLTLSFLYDSNNSGQDGVVFASGVPTGENMTYQWTPSVSAGGQYYVFGMLSDSRGKRAFAYSESPIQIGETTGAAAELRVIEPDGINDVREDGRILIEWEMDVPPGAEGVLSLYLDTDGEGADGNPIATGFTVDDESSFLFSPGAMEPGTYAIYGVLDWNGGQEIAYSEFFEVTGFGCACQTAGTNPKQNALPPMEVILSVIGVVCIGLLRSRRKFKSC